MRILGIDPGLQRTGFALLAVDPSSPTRPPELLDAGVFRLKASRPVAERLAELHEDLSNFIEAHEPTHGAIEALYAHRDFPATSITMAHARGVIMLCMARAGVPISELPANTVKKAIAGRGHASKEQVAGAVASLFSLDKPPEPFDVADAMAVAYCAGIRLAVDAPSV